MFDRPRRRGIALVVVLITTTVVFSILGTLGMRVLSQQKQLRQLRERAQLLQIWKAATRRIARQRMNSKEYRGEEWRMEMPVPELARADAPHSGVSSWPVATITISRADPAADEAHPPPLEPDVMTHWLIDVQLHANGKRIGKLSHPWYYLEQDSGDPR